MRRRRKMKEKEVEEIEDSLDEWLDEDIEQPTEKQMRLIQLLMSNREGAEDVRKRYTVLTKKTAGKLISELVTLPKKNEKIKEEKKEKEVVLDDFALDKKISESLIKEILEMAKTGKVDILGYLRKKHGKESIEELSEDEGKMLKKELEDYLAKKNAKGEKRIGDYVIRSIENGFFEVKKIDGTTYTVHPIEGLCDCPDMRFRTKDSCKHIRMVQEAFPDIKKELEEREVARSRVIERVPIEASFEPIDRWDKDMIIKHLTDETIQKYYVYEFEQDGKIIIGLTSDCVVDLAHWIGGIETVDEHILDAGDKYMAKVTVKDTTRDFSVSGFAEESKWFGKGRVNKFAARIAFRKAQRNALRRLIPKFIEEAIIQRYKEIKERKEK